MKALLEELRRRKVFRTAVIYLVAGWGMVEVSATLFPLMGLPEWGPRLVLAVVAAGFPVAVGLAWFFDVGPGGVRASGDASGVAERHVRLGQTAVVGGAVLVGLAIPTFIFLNRGAGGEQESTRSAGPRPASLLGPERSIAVLPFRNLSALPENQYFSDGITDEIVSALARFEDLRVLGRTAAARVAELGGSTADVARSLDAGFILEGSVRREAERVRISTTLTEAATSDVRWSRDFDRDLTVDQIFDVQRQVALAVADELKARLAPASREYLGAPPTRNLEAFDHYLRGSHELFRRTPASVTRAIAEYRAASQLDPGFTAAQAREAYAYALFVDWEWPYPGASPEELQARGRRLVEAALSRDSMSAEAWLARAYLDLMEDRRDPGRAVPAFERSLALDPSNPEAYHQYGQTLMTIGRYGEAAAAYHGALALDPTRAMTMVPLGALAYRGGNVVEARRWADSAVKVGPEIPYAWSIRADLRAATGDPAGGVEDAERALAIDPSYPIPARAALASSLFRAGDTARAVSELDRAIAALVDPARPGQTDAFFLGSALVAMGRHDEAIEMVSRASPRAAWLWFYLQHPNFDPVRDDPRFAAVESDADPRVRGEAPRAVPP